MNIDISNDITITKGNKVIKISGRHAVYVRDIVILFDHYFNSVLPVEKGGKLWVDFSLPTFHKVVNYDKQEILFPSFSEPVDDSKEYFNFANLKKGDTVMDLGAYSGLTSILFADAVGEDGTVISVEADHANAECQRINIKNYTDRTGINNIKVIGGAIWNHNNGVEFSSELNMGSGAVEFLGRGRGTVSIVPSFTIGELARKNNLDRVDFVKCDIEGGETFMLLDAEFFDKFSPKIIIETHNNDTEVLALLENLNYSVEVVHQNGTKFNLLRCTPKGKNV